MIDNNFFKKNGKFKLGVLADLSESKLMDESKRDLIINNVSNLYEAAEGDVTFLQNPAYIDSFTYTKASAAVISEKDIKYAPKSIALLISENPYYSFAKITEKFYHQENLFMSVSPLSNIDNSVNIGDRTIVRSGVFIGPNCVIGKNCYIHPNVTILNSIIGDNVIIHSGAKIGQDGFGFAFHKGKHHKVLQLGRVIIENDVEIGANTTIDRGSGPDTVIGEGTKIDNLVQIGHNCKIGKHCIIVAQVGISGSSEIGDYTVIAGQSGVAGHLKIGSNVKISARCGVIKDLQDNEIVGGFPAVPIKEFHRQSLALKKLGRKKSELDND